MGVCCTETTEIEQRLEAIAFYSQGAQLPSPLGRYVEEIVHLFYHGDDVVRGDPELQAWCREITEVGLCQAQDRGWSVPGPDPSTEKGVHRTHCPEPLLSLALLGT